MTNDEDDEWWVFWCRHKNIFRHVHTQTSFSNYFNLNSSQFIHLFVFQDIFMFVSNLDEAPYGHLINADNFDTSHIYNELWQIFDNHWDFEQRYIHPNYTKSFDPDNTPQQVQIFINKLWNIFGLFLCNKTTLFLHGVSLKVYSFSNFHCHCELTSFRRQVNPPWLIYSR